jgi:hypothetical protein
MCSSSRTNSLNFIAREDSSAPEAIAIPSFLSVLFIHRSVESAPSAVFLHFPRNLSPDFLQYTCERLELTSHGEKSAKAKTTKEN